MNIVKVIFKNEKYNYKTNVNQEVSFKDVEKYFVGQSFDCGAGEKEDMQICIAIELYDKNYNRILN